MLSNLQEMEDVLFQVDSFSQVKCFFWKGGSEGLGFNKLFDFIK